MSKPPPIVATVVDWSTITVCSDVVHTPRGVAVGPDGTVVVADTHNNRVQCFDPDGTFVRQWGFRGRRPGELNCPCGVAVGPDGTVVVADTHNQRLQVFS